MSASTSSLANASLPQSSPSSPHNLYTFLQFCCYTTVGSFTITAFAIASILVLLPLYVLVLYLGFQQQSQQHSRMTLSHSDVLTYHMVIAELMSVLGFTLICCGVHADLPPMTAVGIYLFIINLSGQFYFHLLTCVERYLAVVHPITYLNLREANGIRIRNITIGCVWLLVIGSTGFLFIQDQVVIDLLCYCMGAVGFSVTSFCSLSVLCVLIRPGPGAGSRGRLQVDKTKLRPFYTILAIMGVLLLKFGGNAVTIALYDSPNIGMDRSCGLWLSVVWFSLPSSLVLPLLFLHRAGKLVCCENSKQSGQESD